MFGHLVDETVVYMFSQRKVKKEYFFAQIKDLNLVEMTSNKLR
jgi:hypothetical protein